jgi:hypothetical protein
VSELVEQQFAEADYLVKSQSKRLHDLIVRPKAADEGGSYRRPHSAQGLSARPTRVGRLLGEHRAVPHVLGTVSAILAIPKPPHVLHFPAVSDPHPAVLPSAKTSAPSCRSWLNSSIPDRIRPRN